MNPLIDPKEIINHCVKCGVECDYILCKDCFHLVLGGIISSIGAFIAGWLLK